MKIRYRDPDPFVKAPNPAARVILVYGPDAGLIKERARIMGKTVVADLNDPFNAVTLTSDILSSDPARLSDEAGAISMMGGDRLIRIENAGDKLTPLLKTYLENPSSSALIIAEAAELTPRSSLRKLCESAKNAAAIACYIDDEKDLLRLIRENLNADGLQIEHDATLWLAANISGDRLKVRSELEKLMTYKGLNTPDMDKNPISLADVQACCGEAGALDIDDLVYNVAGNQAGLALKKFNQLIEEGVSFIVVLRALQSHFRRLHLSKVKMQTGQSVEQAMKALSPPIFFKQEAAFKAQLNRWSLEGLNKTLQKLMQLEAQCKQTGVPVETLCAQAVLGISKSRG